MLSPSPRSAVELFHLALLRALRTGPTGDRIALKGGCNLRFFFQSPRYSEDMDLDAERMPVQTLRGAVDRAVQSPLVTRPLAARGIEIVDATKPKQTETTQRWKVGLKVRGYGAELRTKVEFSKRDQLDGVRVEAADPKLMREYQLPGLLLPHYPAEHAVAQKVRALAGRPETQARDVFDLAILLARPGLEPKPVERPVRETALARALALSFADFKGQVVAYLEPEQQAVYDSKAAWEQLQLDVVAWLEGQDR